MAKKRKSRKRGLASFAEEFAIDLLFEASNGRLGRKKAVKEGVESVDSQISFRDRRSLLDSITKLLGAQDAPEEDDEDGIAFYRERLNEPSGEDRSGADTLTDEAGIRPDDATDSGASTDDTI